MFASSLKTSLVRKAISLALRQNAPKTIPLSDIEKLRERNYYSTYLKSEINGDRFLAEDMNECGIGGFWWNKNETSGYPASVPNKSLGLLDILIIQYYGKLEIRHTSATQFFLSRLTFLPQRKLISANLKMWLFKKRKLAREERNDVLVQIYDRFLETGTPHLSVETFLNEKFGVNWPYHPSNNLVRVYYKWVLDSFCHSGELSSTGGGYMLAPQALKTLADFESENARHRDSLRQQRKLSWLTLALVFVGVCQVLISLFQ